MRRLLPLSLLLGFGVAPACSGGDPAVEPGRVGWPCPNDNNCIAPLRCIEGACAAVVDEVDAGPPPDAGTPPDAGQPDDAGAPDAEIDAGVPDTGVEDSGCHIPATLTAIADQVFGANRDPHCNQPVCHGDQAAGGVRLTPPLNDLHATLLGPTRDPQAPERNLVVPGDPAQSRLYVIMSEDDPAGQGGKMPPGGLVPFCELEAVRLWILNGAQND